MLSIIALMDTMVVRDKHGGRARRHWPDEVKRQVVGETYAEGASVAEVAQRPAANADLLRISERDLCLARRTSRQVRSPGLCDRRGLYKEYYTSAKSSLMAAKSGFPAQVGSGPVARKGISYADSRLELLRVFPRSSTEGTQRGAIARAISSLMRRFSLPNVSLSSSGLSAV